MSLFLQDALVLLALLDTEVTGSLGGRPASVGLRSGALVAFDDCCNGQAWVRVNRLFPSDTFPSPAQVQRGGSLLALDLQVGVVRCAAVVVDENGRPPSDDTYEAEVAVQLSDAAAMWRAVCEFGSRYTDHVIGTYQPFGPDGGCVGGVLGVIVSL